MSEIVMQQVKKSFGDHEVLHDVSIDIEKGEIFGLLGPSGAGKTTIIKILTGQYQYEGSAKLFQKECSEYGPEVYKEIGMVLDNCDLYTRLTCYDNLLFFARIYQIPRKRIIEVLTKVGLLSAKKTQVRNLSKGMKQRLLLARAILHQPKLLFLDEPTSGLDPVTTAEIHKLLTELKEKGTTIFLTTHNMEEAQKLCEKVALLNEGRIVEYGEPEALCRKHNLENMIHVFCKDGKNYEFENAPGSADQLSLLLRNNNIETIHSSEPNLEAVFIKLTGRRLECQ